MLRKETLGKLLMSISKNTESFSYISEEKVMNIFVQLCLALNDIHSQKVIHRDIKPENIFLFENDIVKIGDFGVSKEIEETIQINSTLTGTPYYIAPEVYKNSYDIKSDIWSLGIILLEL